MAGGRRPNLVLVGFMGCGKSTLARLCARTLGVRWYDSDVLATRLAGKPIPRVFAEDGEEAFRSIERQAIQILAAKRGVVVATGGGAMMDGANAAALGRTGCVVYIRITPETVLKRVRGGRGRPMLAGSAAPIDRIRELLAVRGPVYEAAADAVIDSDDMTPDAACREVLGRYQVYRRELEAAARAKS